MPADARQLLVPSRRDAVDEAIRTIVQQIERSACSPTGAFAVRLALEEAMSNALRHGNRNDASKAIRLCYSISAQTIVFEIADEGDGFDPRVVPDPTREENIGIPSGRGLMLMRAYMTEVSFNERGNCVRMTFCPGGGLKAVG